MSNPSAEPDRAAGRAADRVRVAGLLRELAATALRNQPLYRRVTAAAAEDPDVLDVLLGAPPAQQLPVMLLAAVHDRVLAAPDAEGLADWYPTVRAEPRPVGDGPDDPWPAFRATVLDDPAVATTVATRAVQTNEVGRTGATMPAIALASAAAGQPVALVELGASAGLNLLLDRFAYDYGPAGQVGGPSSVRIVPAQRGDRPAPVPEALPRVASRIGVDLSPVDVGDPEACRWLVACSWPEQRERTERLRAALALARSERPEVIRGDAVAEVSALVEAVPTGVHPVVVTTWALAYLSAEAQTELFGRLSALGGGGRDLSLVCFEQPITVPGLPVPPRADGADDPGPTSLLWWRWSDGDEVEARRLADGHPHARWLEWLAR